ncbi:hypothetical protein EW146_g8275 [Bondarzewia mesenterica]|uniref:Uncharacterized protein n=1 Tax=Bondarzewia mesenterica TaxID=1095465 RepID=A0A4S4LFW0_9AGAM|nr:hypothetical protein EW146_g8275 [Bondarzewia mesenterica]
MTLTVLVSFSLLALVVSARPIVPNDGPNSAYVDPSDLQNAVQALFESRSKESAPDCLRCGEDELHVRLITAQEQHAYLSQLDIGDVKALVPLGENGVLSEEEKKLYEMLGGSETMDDVEGGSRPVALPNDAMFDASVSPVGGTEAELSVAGEDSVAEEESRILSTASPQVVVNSRPLIILAFSCTLALLMVICVGASLYAVQIVRSQIFTSRAAWDLLPRLEKQEKIRLPYSYSEKKEKLLGAPSGDTLLGLIDEKAGILVDFDDTSAPSSDEEFYDAPDTSSFRNTDFSSSVANPLLVPLPTSPCSSPLCKPVLMDELDSGTATSPQVDLGHQSAAAPRMLDFALAMQLRPGFGIGADPAWLVRFLMAIFGWVAVLVGGMGGTGQRQRQAIRA